MISMILRLHFTVSKPKAECNGQSCLHAYFIQRFHRIETNKFAIDSIDCAFSQSGKNDDNIGLNQPQTSGSKRVTFTFSFLGVLPSNQSATEHYKHQIKVTPIHHFPFSFPFLSSNLDLDQLSSPQLACSDQGFKTCLSSECASVRPSATSAVAALSRYVLHFLSSMPSVAPAYFYLCFIEGGTVEHWADQHHWRPDFRPLFTLHWWHHLRGFLPIRRCYW